MNKDDDIFLIKKVQKNNSIEAMNILWEKYGDRLYNSFLKYLFVRNINTPLDNEDFISLIYFSFKNAIKKFNVDDNKYHFLQYAHIATKSDAARYFKKYISKKQNILNNAIINENSLNNIYNNKNFCTISLEEKYDDKLKKELKLISILNYLKIFCKQNPNSRIEDIINLKLKSHTKKEICNILNISLNNLNSSFNNFKKSFIEHLNMQ